MGGGGCALVGVRGGGGGLECSGLVSDVHCVERFLLTVLFPVYCVFQVNLASVVHQVARCLLTRVACTESRFSGCSPVRSIAG